MDIDKIVIGKILELMKAQGLSQRELAKRAKINYENFNRLIKGGRSITKSDVLPAVAAALGVPVEALRSIDEYKSPAKTVGEMTPAELVETLGVQSRGLTSEEMDDLKRLRGFESRVSAVAGADLLGALEKMDIIQGELVRSALGLEPRIVPKDPSQILSANRSKVFGPAQAKKRQQGG